MPSNVLKYYRGGERPSVSLTWRNADGAVIDLSTGYEFEFKVGAPGQQAVFTKTTNISGAQTSPNVLISFAPNELDDVPVGLHVAQLRARETAGSQDRFMQLWFQLLDAVN